FEPRRAVAATGRLSRSRPGQLQSTAHQDDEANGKKCKQSADAKRSSREHQHDGKGLPIDETARSRPAKSHGGPDGWECPQADVRRAESKDRLPVRNVGSRDADGLRQKLPQVPSVGIDESHRNRRRRDDDGRQFVTLAMISNEPSPAPDRESAGADEPSAV